VNDGSKEKSKKHESVWLEIAGSTDIGVIDSAAAAAIGFPAGPIRLAEGLPGPKGYGLAHVQENHGRVSDLKNLGLDGAQASIVEVAANWELIILGNEANRVVLVRKHRARYLSLVVQVFEGKQGHFWSAVTVFIGPRIKAANIVYQKAKVTVE
jgi:hypothetical protein